MLGQRYGRLTVQSLARVDERHRKFYKCSCACGNRIEVQATLLRSGNTKSCGCLSRDVKKSSRLPNDAGVIGQIILQYKRHAKDRGLEFNLFHREVDRIVRMPCHYCGIASGNLKKTKNRKEGFAHNGIDRIDSSRGYDIGNVVPCCGLCNRAKRDMPRDQFIAWACRVAAHQKAMADQWGGFNQIAQAAE